MICSPLCLALPLPLLPDLRGRVRKPLYFLKFFIKYQQDKSCVRHGIYPYLCPKYCNERYMDRTSGSVPLSLSIDSTRVCRMSTRVCRMACDMRGWSVAMPLIEEMATQMDSSIWSTCQTYTSYRYNNRAQKMLGYGRQLFGAFLLCAPHLRAPQA